MFTKCLMDKKIDHVKLISVLAQRISDEELRL